MRKILTLGLLLAVANVFGQEPNDAKTVTFRFLPASDAFYVPWAGNGAELERLYVLVDSCRAEIAAGSIPLYVDGYCASLPTVRENLRTARVRANRVKSELITVKGLEEAHFITANHAVPCDGRRDVVVVTLRIPAGEPQAVVPEEPRKEEPAEVVSPPHPAAKPEPAAEPAPALAATSEPAAAPAKPYCVAVRTNVLYDALLLPTLGVEWRLTRDAGIKLDGSRSWWGDRHGKVQKIWLLSPEVRWYLLRDKRFYAGVSANFGRFNLYRYALGGIVSKQTGYQGSLWGAGLTVGYQLPLSRRWAVDFNLGLGYTRFEYDTFGITNRVRVYKERDRSRNCWGPTQAGISLVWTIGGKR
ncbi:DUF3575 domain-containing protein [Alistipes sp.]|uniref:DUF3575 domain-containing protein n=1 Tax=Alistipes sp. TaxID=1872444 RepID=UPI003AEF47BA